MVKKLEQLLATIAFNQKDMRRTAKQHSDIYNSFSTALARYHKREENEEGSGNDHTFQRSLYHTAFNSLTFILHVAENGDKAAINFASKTLQYKGSMDTRLDYIDSLVAAAGTSTAQDQGVGFSPQHLKDWQNAKKLISDAIETYSRNGVKTKKKTRTGRGNNELSKNPVYRKLIQAYGKLKGLKKAASKAYDGNIPA
jgi:hypothetical protein